MDKIGLKVNMVTFLMSNFMGMKDMPNGIKLFKQNVENLVKSNQLPSDIRDIVYNMYGIVNSDTYYEARVELKLYQIKMLMHNYSQAGRNNFIVYFSRECDEGNISKSAEKIIRMIYEIPEKVNGSIKNKNISINTTRPPLKPNKSQLQRPLPPLKDKGVVDQEVLQDIESIKPAYLSKMYYRYLNSRYDGCLGSQKYFYMLVTDSKGGKPDGGELYYGKETSDGCSTRTHYVPIEPEMFKSSLDPCTNGFSMKGC